MGLKKEEIENIKKSLLGQLDNFPEDKREGIKAQIEGMSDSDVEEFVKKNQLTHMPGGCIFCSIVEGKSPSFKIDECDDAIAILELNPLSQGHTLVVPKKHSDKVNIKVNDFAGEIVKKIKDILKPKDVTIREIQIMDHALLEVIPIFGDEKDRKKASQEELIETQKILTGEIKNEEMIEDDSDAEKVVEEVEELEKMPPRIPRFS